MRVTGNTFTDSLVSQLNLISARQHRLQNQASTGQRISAPEDDPAAMHRSMDIRAEASSVQQYRRNVSALHSRAGATFDALRAVKNVSDRAGEIAILADGTRSPEELRIYATEVTQMIQQAVQLMNSKHQGQHLFGGTMSDQPPFTLTQGANGEVTAVTYNGNAQVATSEIEDGLTLSVDVPGANATGSGERGLISDSRTGADFFNHLISLQNNLLAGDTAAIAATDRAALALDEENLLFHVGNNGAIQMRLETADKVADTRAMSLEQMLSKEADADLAGTLVRLNEAQYSYQAALQSGATIMNHSLLDYLR